MMKFNFNLAAGVIASAVTYLFGGWTGVLSTLILFMILDYVTGIVVAAFFHKSNKTESGSLSSVAGYKGLFKKIGILIAVAIANHVDILMGVNGVLLNAIIYGFIANEGLSILENIGNMGVKLPDKLVKALDTLLDQEGKE